MVDYKKKYLKYKLKYLELIGGSNNKTNYSAIATDLLFYATTSREEFLKDYDETLKDYNEKYEHVLVFGKIDIDKEKMYKQIEEK